MARETAINQDTSTLAVSGGVQFTPLDRRARDAVGAIARIEHVTSIEMTALRRALALQSLEVERLVREVARLREVARNG